MACIQDDSNMKSLIQKSWQAMGDGCVAFSARLPMVVTTLCVWSVLVGSAWAAKKKAVEAPPEKSYVQPYFLVVLLMGLGIMILCRPGKRADEPFKKQEEE